MSTAMLGYATLGTMILGYPGDSTIVTDLITDRTQEDLNHLKQLAKIPWKDMTNQQKLAYGWYGRRASYDFNALNRVETAVAELGVALGLTLSTKTDWGRWDLPTQSEMERYLGNVMKIREKCVNVAIMPELPESMDYLTYEMANNIEKVLVIAYGIADSVIRSGDIYSGEVT